MNAKGQITFSPVDGKLNHKNNDLIYSSSTTTINFSLKGQVSVLPQKNFVTVNGQILQITALKFDGYQHNKNLEILDAQKELLAAYSTYELKYFSDLGIQVMNPSNQWVVSKSRGWLIWYFKVGQVPAQTHTQTQIQLFATTVIGDEIFLINAPILNGKDFSKAALIVNELMEALTITNEQQ